MKNCEDKENHPPQNNLYGISRKNIKKIPRYYKRDFKSALTTVPKSFFDENQFSEVIKDIPHKCMKPVIISPLKEILCKSPVHKPENIEIIQCKYIRLKGEEKGHIEEFKLFNEKEVPLFTQGVTKRSLREHGYDNDAQSDNEQINNGIEFMQNEIKKALKNFKRKNIKNIKKFEGDIVMDKLLI